MKHLLCVTLFLLSMGNGTTNAQCITSTSINGSLNFSSSVSSIPNDMAPTGWTKNSTPDQARTGIQIDCTTLPLVASANGGTWTRMADKISAQEAISRSISGFVIGTSYEVTFEQSLVKNWARSSGNVKVILGSTSRFSPTIALPVANVAQTGWQTVTVGPFVANATTMTLTLEAHSNQDGTGSSPMPGSCSGYTQNALAADLMIDDIRVCPISSLPLNFLSFDLSSVTLLEWKVVDTENELEKFIVYKSNNGLDWKEIGEVRGKSSESQYSFMVVPGVSESYYRVVAYNKYTKLISVSSIISDKTLLEEKPCGWSYSKDAAVLNSVFSGNEITAVLYDLKGNSLLQYNSSTSPYISVGALPDGIYIIITNTGEQSCSFRFAR